MRVSPTRWGATDILILVDSSGLHKDNFATEISLHGRQLKGLTRVNSMGNFESWQPCSAA